MKDTKRYLSLYVDISDKKIVVFGGGTVADRKVSNLLGSKQIVVVSVTLTETLQTLWENDQIDHINAKLQVKDDVLIKALINKAFLVVPATSDRDLNIAIKKLADEEGILCNDVDQDDSVLIPSQVHTPEASVAITTYGSAPALLNHLKKQAEAIVTPQMDAMIRIQSVIRNALIKQTDDVEGRRALLHQILDSEEIWALLPDSEDQALQMAKDLVLD
ncbi:MAG: bifunctional precorrin-2 dehydrogenase/sirohydrochlorin ferrochelatase [Gammaproteobacteria bacterium]|jgi:precorrin-2 dehydrogenase/sirohydrochlorin ferrochelatase